MTVHPKFALGKFVRPPITYHNLLVVTCRNTCISSSDTLSQKHTFFTSTLISLRRELEHLCVFATDGERTLIDAFFHELRFCKKNIHDNKYKESLAKEIIDDVFGKQVGSTY